MDRYASDDNESASSIQQSFQAFMLNGGTTSTQPNIGIHLPSNTPPSNQKQKIVSTQRIINEAKRTRQRYHQIQTKFRTCLNNGWLGTDDQLKQIVHLISTIRNRLPSESIMLNNYREVRQRPKKEWSHHSNHNSFLLCSDCDLGKRRTNIPLSSKSKVTTDKSCYLMEKDVKLAFSHDIFQQEKMLEGLRKMLRMMSEDTESLSRILDEVMKHDTDAMIESNVISSAYITPNHNNPMGTRSNYHDLFNDVNNIPTLLEDIFTSLSLELYRKQSMAQNIIDSMNDNLFIKSNTTDISLGQDQDNSSQLMDLEAVSPRDITNKYDRDWSRINKNHLESAASFQYFTEKSSQEEIQR